MIETKVIYYGDNIVKPKTRKLIPSPASPEMPIMEILMEMAYNNGHTTSLRPNSAKPNFACPQNVRRNHEGAIRVKFKMAV